MHDARFWSRILTQAYSTGEPIKASADKSQLTFVEQVSTLEIYL